MTDDARAALKMAIAEGWTAQTLETGSWWDDAGQPIPETIAAAILASLDGWHFAPNVATADWTESTKAAPVDAAEEWRAGDCCPTCEEENGHRLALAALAAPTEEKR